MITGASQYVLQYEFSMSQYILQYAFWLIIATLVTASIYVYKQRWLLLGILCRLSKPSLTTFTIMNWPYYCLIVLQHSHSVSSKEYLTGPRSSVTCLATDACLTADPGVTSSILARSHSFVEIDHEIISTVILLPSADSFKKGCCQLQAKVCAQITG